MNKQVRNLYVAINDNKVVHASTSLSEFVRTMSQLVTQVKSYPYYQKKFKDEKVIEHIDHLKKSYYFQKVK
ncbi:hypothetical protein J0X14_14130 [Muricauda sp. CAU 1633]|uniref:hypothetical protein n=1 Tax=Allomuricauda sp. CAU 1633 TaxID=2816036 RepID=UPI001A8D303F|nr:hypothetical protein [Muricauda sp. CAU 1633]MBO0323442.1 hypothetical protein [Muricauda sp. CAU 1633]